MRETGTKQANEQIMMIHCVPCHAELLDGQHSHELAFGAVS